VPGRNGVSVRGLEMEEPVTFPFHLLKVTSFFYILNLFAEEHAAFAEFLPFGVESGLIVGIPDGQ
jgi:hypothetical protein